MSANTVKLRTTNVFMQQTVDEPCAQLQLPAFPEKLYLIARIVTTSLVTRKQC